MTHVTKTTTQRAKKTYRCTWCWQSIEQGEEYKRYRHFNQGDTGTEKMHSECYDAMQEEADYWGGDFEWIPGQERPTKKERNKMTKKRAFQ